MPRKKAADALTAAIPPAPPVIDANAVFTASTFRALFGLRASTLRREVREGRLRVAKRSGRYFLLGEWILDWLRAGEVRPKQQPGDN